MNDKKIFKILQKWFPELKGKELPKKKERRNYEYFYYWLAPTEIKTPDQPSDPEEYQEKRYRGYLLDIDRQQHFSNGVESSAVFQDYGVDAEAIQNRIEVKTEPLFEHYEKYKDLIGDYYALNSHVIDIVLKEIYGEIKRINHRMILISTLSFDWLAVPDQLEEIEEFIRLFQKQFKNPAPRIEVYEVFDLSFSDFINEGLEEEHEVTDQDNNQGNLHDS